MHSEKWISIWFVCGEILKIICIVTACTFLFFDSFLGMVIILPYGIYLAVNIKDSYRKFIKKRYIFQFKDTLSCLLTALEAGYSAEQAIGSVRNDIQMIYGREACMTVELEQMERKLELGQNVESVMAEFAEKTDIREIRNFADIFTVAKRSGGDIISLVRAAGRDMYEKIELEREIESIISANRTECLIMRLMPLGIILYFRLFSPSFLEPLYETSLGRMAMIVLAAVYFFMSEYVKRIVDKAGGY